MNGIFYLSFDSLDEGVGASQVLAYMKQVVKRRPVTIVSFEKRTPNQQLKDHVEINGINWIPLPFGKFGVFGGIGRIFRMARQIDRSKIIHARSTSAGISSLLRIPKRWVWDCRSLQADQRRAISDTKKFSLSFLLLRLSEFLLARYSKKIIVITAEVIPILANRYRIDAKKMKLIPTCADMSKFQFKPIPDSDEIKILLSGTFSPAYDLKLTQEIISEIKRFRKVSVTIAVANSDTGLWKNIDYDYTVSVTHDEMPRLIQSHHAGMSIWRNNLGVCLKSVASTKSAEYLACGRPIFVNSFQGDLGKLIKNGRTGIVTDETDSQAVATYAQEFLKLLDDLYLPERCRELAEKYFSLEKGIETLEEIYSSLD